MEPEEQEAEEQEPEEQEPEDRRSCCDKTRSFFHGTAFLIYCSHGFSAWGDRMWQFAIGLYLVDFNSNSLLVTAAFGLSSNVAIILFGALVGEWVDKTSRIRAVRISLAIQNMCVICNAVLIVLFYYFQEEVRSEWDGGMFILFEILVIILGVIADLASTANRISIENDWVVTISAGDKDRLAAMNSTNRRIDLTTNILAPIITGQIMTYGSMAIGAMFIASWNLLSMFAEYLLLSLVYRRVPELAYKKKASEAKEETVEAPKSKCGVCTEMMLGSFLTLIRGWKTYWAQSVRNAGISLALLYMTVMGFDSITTGFAKTQGLTESIISLTMAGGALFGIGGTFVFPRMRRALGVTRTGLYGYTSQLLCLIPCVISIWMPGSPFDLDPRPYCSNLTEIVNATLRNVSTVSGSWEMIPGINDHELDALPGCKDPPPPSQISVWLLMGGIIASRFGLWLADLTVTQLLQENVQEHERGIVNGVQSSLNMIFELTKFILVITLPHPRTFGLLILLSFSFIVLADLTYAAYSWSQRGHLFHFGKCCGNISAADATLALRGEAAALGVGMLSGYEEVQTREPRV